VVRSVPAVHLRTAYSDGRFADYPPDDPKT
jgi:hypothetical protein